jgi:signal transduction histidine kinase
MRTSQQIKTEIEAKFGFFPPFFTPALLVPQVLENLWQQTLSAYVNNPLPTLFKEKLSAYLSRFCAVPYCMICHSCSLRPLGVKAKEVLELLESPPPSETEIDRHLRKLTVHSDRLLYLSEWDSEIQQSILNCAVFIALEREEAEYCRQELIGLIGSVNYQLLISLIAYIKTCHTWMEAHPDVADNYEADQRAIDYLCASLSEEPGLANFFDRYKEKVSVERLSWTQRRMEIAERKRREEILRQLNEQLEQRVQERTVELRETNANLVRLNQELERFAFIAAHDLQEPLRKIKIYTEWLVQSYQGQFDKQADKYIAHITDGTLRMQAQLKDLLTYSQLLAEEFVVKPTNLEMVLKQTLTHLSTTIETSRAVIATDSLPTVQANPKQMALLFTHLIDNALKFRSEATPEVYIAASLHSPDRWLIAVRDNCIGIKPQYTERIFEVFQRLNSRDKYPGTGMGLAICRKIVERHGGRIWVESEFGVGTTFLLTLPQ